MKIKNILYHKGDFYLTQGAPGNQAGRIKKTKFSTIKNRGNGWSEEKIHSKLFLEVENNGDVNTIEIAREFHENIGRITTKKLEKIEQLKNKDINIINDSSMVNEIIKEMKEIIIQ